MRLNQQQHQFLCEQIRPAALNTHVVVIVRVVVSQVLMRLSKVDSSLACLLSLRELCLI